MEENKNSLSTSCTVSRARTNCFELLNPDESKLIEKNQVNVTYKKGETIVKQGSFASHITYISSGLAKIFMEKNNEVLILKIIPGGNLIGLTALSDESNTFPYSAVAYQDTTIQLIELGVIKQLINQNPKFGAEIINILCSNNLQVYGRFFCFENKNSYGRLADILLCLAGRIFKSEKFDLFLSRKEIAELAGMSTENVIRMLKKFKDDGLININGKTFEISNYELLCKISECG